MQSKTESTPRNDKVLVAGMADYVSVGNFEYLLLPFLLGMDCFPVCVCLLRVESFFFRVWRIPSALELRLLHEVW